jgi:hypothetical protein
LVTLLVDYALTLSFDRQQQTVLRAVPREAFGTARRLYLATIICARTMRYGASSTMLLDGFLLFLIVS